jgi:signal-transduction protein with cAMP-binding, CBS, and nucleotidyltransferase domain
MISASDLEQFPIFSGLDGSLLTEIAKFCSKRTYRVGEVCASEASKAENVFLLAKGGINIERKFPENWIPPASAGHNVVYSLKENDLFGWSSIVEPGVHTGTARCSQDSEVIVINGRQLLNVLDNNREAAYPFMKRLATIIALRLIYTSNFLMQEMANFAAYRSM